MIKFDLALNKSNSVKFLRIEHIEHLRNLFNLNSFPPLLKGAFEGVTKSEAMIASTPHMRPGLLPNFCNHTHFKTSQFMSSSFN